MAANTEYITVRLDTVELIQHQRRIVRCVADRLQELVEEHRRVCGTEGGAPEECCILTSLRPCIETLRNAVDGGEV